MNPTVVGQHHFSDLKVSHGHKELEMRLKDFMFGDA